MERRMTRVQIEKQETTNINWARLEEKNLRSRDGLLNWQKGPEQGCVNKGQGRDVTQIPYWRNVCWPG